MTDQLAPAVMTVRVTCSELSRDHTPAPQPMSHAATKWAFDQPGAHRDMKPSEWAVLVVLADCHNPVNGCFPSQDYIAERINLSERAVRDHLFRLRSRRLVNWEAAREDGKRGSNRYSLAFEADFQPEESSGSSTGEIASEQPADSDSFNRKNLPPNLVREPVIEPVKVEREARARPEELKPEDDRDFQALLKRYPGVHSPGLAFPPWLRLDDEGRRRALARLDAYIAERRKAKNDTVHALQRYLGERLFDQVDEPADGRPAMTTAPVRSKEFWWLLRHRLDRGDKIKSSFEMARDQGIGLSVAVGDLPGETELKALVSIEAGSAAFDAWRRWFEGHRIRFSDRDTHICGKFIYVASEYPPGWVHGPPESGGENEEVETAEDEGMG